MILALSILPVLHGGGLVAALLFALGCLAVGVLTIPATDIDARMILPGPAKFYIGAYAANGADTGTLFYLGATEPGGAEFHFAKTAHHAMVEQYLNEVASFPIKEEYTLKATFPQLNLGNFYQILQTADTSMTLVGGLAASTSSSLTFGEQKTVQYWQLVVKFLAPPGATNGQRLIQAYKTVIHQLGAVKLDKTKPSALAVTWKCLTDTTAIASGKAPVLQFLDS
jgi:hypothetical protein